MAYRYFFGWFGGLTTYNLVWFWFGPRNVTAEYADGRYNPAAWSEYGFVAAVLIFLGIIVTSIGTHKHIPDLIEPPQRKITLGAVFRELFEIDPDPSSSTVSIEKVLSNFLFFN